MGDLHGLECAGNNARPDDMAVLAPMLGMKDDRSGLTGEFELLFDAGDVIAVLGAGEGALPGIRIDGETVEIFFAAGGFRDGVPFIERAGEVAGNRAADMSHLDALVVVRVQEMGGELAAIRPLAGFGYHDFFYNARDKRTVHTCRGMREIRKTAHGSRSRIACGEKKP